MKYKKPVKLVLVKRKHRENHEHKMKHIPHLRGDEAHAETSGPSESRVRASHEPTKANSWRTNQDRQMGGESPILVPMHPSRRPLPYGPHIPMYRVPLPGENGMLNPSDAKGYPLYHGMHPIPAPYFLRPPSHYQDLSVSSDESTSDKDCARIKSSERRDANQASTHIGEESAPAVSSTHTDGKRHSSNGAPIRNRRKHHHPFVHSYPEADRGFHMPHPMPMYPGYHHPSLLDVDNETFMCQASKTFEVKE